MPDPWVRGLLALIALLLGAGVLQDGLRGGADQGAGDNERRYQVVAIRGAGGPTLIRTDTVTGRVWQRSLRDDAAWQLLAEEASEAEEPADPQATAPSAGARVAAHAPATPEQIEGYLALLDDEDAGVRAFAAQKVGMAPPEKALGPLTRALDDPEPQVVLAAIASLRKLGDPAPQGRLQALASHADPRVQEAARGAAQALQ